MYGLILAFQVSTRLRFCISALRYCFAVLLVQRYTVFRFCQVFAQIIFQKK